MRHKMLIGLALCAFNGALAGCSNGKATEPPSPRLMTAPAALEDIKPGDDVIQKHAELRRQYGRETSKVRGLQGYVRAVLKK